MRMNQQEAKGALAAKRRESKALTLTAEVSKLIIAAGGPTYRQSGKGFRCVQTGESVGKHTKNFTARVFSLAGGGEFKANEDAAKAALARAFLPGAYISFGYVYCPKLGCSSSFGTKSSLAGSVQTCGRCGTKFRVD